MPLLTSFFKKKKPKTELKAAEKLNVESEFADPKPNYKIFCDEFQRHMRRKFEKHSDVIENEIEAAKSIKQRSETVQQFASATGRQMGKTLVDAMPGQSGIQTISNVMESGGNAMGSIITLIQDETERNKQQNAKNFMRINKMAADDAAFSTLCQKLADELYFRFKFTIRELYHAPGTEEGVVAFARFFADALEKSLKEKTITDEELNTGKLEVLMRAAVPPESDDLYYQDLTKKFTQKLRKSTTNGEEWSIQGVLLHAPGQVDSKKRITIHAPNLKGKYHPIIFHNLEEAKDYGYTDKRNFVPANSVSRDAQWTPVVRNWFSDSHYEVSGSSPTLSSHKVRDGYDFDDWVFHNDEASVNLKITTKLEGPALTVTVEASFTPPDSRSVESMQFIKFYQDMVSLIVELPEEEFSLDKDSITGELSSNSGEIPTRPRTTSKFRYYLFGERTTTTTDVSDYELSSPKLSPSMGAGTEISHHAEMKNCYDKNHAARPYNTADPDGSMHVYFRAPDRLNKPAPSAKGCLTLKTTQTFIRKNVTNQEKGALKDIRLRITLLQRLWEMSIWRSVANHQMMNNAKLDAECTISLSDFAKITSLEFVEPQGIKIKKDKHIKKEIAEQLSKSPIVEIKWIKNDTFGRPDLLPSSPLEKSSFSV